MLMVVIELMVIEHIGTGMIVFLCILGIAGLFILVKYKLLDAIKVFINNIQDRNKKEKIDKDDTDIKDIDFDEVIENAGYAYDEMQDIFYSTMDAWQREMGYCRLYDEAAAPLGMILDCEPIYFKYGGKRWLIEFWKGQYDLTTGCEVGIYTTDQEDVMTDVFTGPLFDAVSDSEFLKISYTLEKNGKFLFKREGMHWWLTGFMLGEFSEPWELTMNIQIAFRDRMMLLAFIKGLFKAGYLRDEFKVRKNYVSIKYNVPKTPQPYSRTDAGDWVIQRKNEFMCEQYQKIAKGIESLSDKIKIIQKESPELFRVVMKLGKTKELFDGYDQIKKYLE